MKPFSVPVRRRGARHGFVPLDADRTPVIRTRAVSCPARVRRGSVLSGRQGRDEAFRAVGLRAAPSKLVTRFRRPGAVLSGRGGRDEAFRAFGIRATPQSSVTRFRRAGAVRPTNPARDEPWGARGIRSRPVSRAPGPRRRTQPYRAGCTDTGDDVVPPAPVLTALDVLLRRAGGRRVVRAGGYGLRRT